MMFVQSNCDRPDVPRRSVKGVILLFVIAIVVYQAAVCDYLPLGLG